MLEITIIEDITVFQRIYDFYVQVARRDITFAHERIIQIPEISLDVFYIYIYKYNMEIHVLKNWVNKY